AYALQSTTIRGRGFGNRAFGFTCVLRTSPRTRTTRACPARITAALRLTTQPRQRAPVKVTVVVSVHRPSRIWSESHWAFTKKSPSLVETTSDVTAGVPSWRTHCSHGDLPCAAQHDASVLVSRSGPADRRLTAARSSDRHPDHPPQHEPDHAGEDTQARQLERGPHRPLPGDPRLAGAGGEQGHH